MTEQQMKAFGNAASHLIEWLNDNGHPHMTVIVTQSNAELVEGLMAYSNDTFLKD